MLVILIFDESLQLMCRISFFDGHSLWVTLHIPRLFFLSGSSLQTFKHYLQLLDGKFCKYDYDPKTNLKIYGSETAPSYNLKNVVAPTKIFVGKGDHFSTG